MKGGALALISTPARPRSDFQHLEDAGRIYIDQAYLTARLDLSTLIAAPSERGSDAPSNDPFGYKRIAEA